MRETLVRLLSDHESVRGRFLPIEDERARTNKIAEVSPG